MSAGPIHLPVLAAQRQLGFGWDPGIRAPEPVPGHPPPPRRPVAKGRPSWPQRYIPGLGEPRRLPSTYGECQRLNAGSSRPGVCPFVSCRHHLYSERPEDFAALVDASPRQWPKTCSLEIADAVAGECGDVQSDVEGVGSVIDRGLCLTGVGAHLGLSGERVRQLQGDALERVKAHPIMQEAAGDIDPGTAPRGHWGPYIVQARAASVDWGLDDD